MQSNQVGVIYGKVGSTGFDLAVADPELRRLDYVEVQDGGRRILGQVESLERRSSLSFDEAMAIPAGHSADMDDRVAAAVRVIGFRDQRGLVQVPRTPFRAGTPVLRADDQLVAAVLGLEVDGLYLGHVKGSRIPVHLSLDVLAQKHLSVLAKTGAGKSYTVGVVLEELLKSGVPLVILDPHGEYGTLRSPNMEETELDAMVRFGVKPKAFQKQVKEYALDTQLNPEAERLVLEGVNLEGRDIVDMLGGRLSGGQVGVLYQAVKEVKEYLPAYTLKDVMDAVSRNKSNAKWNVLNALEVLESTGIFGIRGTPVEQLVKQGQCSIVNLKGVPPDIQEIVVTRIAGLLWSARKRSDVPAHILVVEEAHNFCPERNVGNAVSGAVLRTVASEGRKFGMGLVIVSQRPAKIDKNILSQCNTQIVLKVTNPNDLRAIGSSVENISNETVDEIQRLPIGVALVAGGGLTQPVFVDVRPRVTRHGGRSVSVLQPNGPDEAEEEEAPAPRRRHTPDIVQAPTPPATAPATQAPPTAPKAGDPFPAPPRQTPPAPLPPAPRPAEPPASAPSFEPVPGEPRDAPADAPWGPASRVPSDTEAPRRLAADRVPPSPTVPAAQAGAPPTAGAAGPVRAPAEMPPTASIRTWSDTEAAEIHRVASRVGLVGPGLEPRRTLALIERVARQNRRDPTERLTLYLDIARGACGDEPVCIRCPIQTQCLYHRDAQQKRQKERAPVRRLWSR